MTVQTQPNNRGAWDVRTRVAVYGQALLLLVAWSVALGRLIGGRFWDAPSNAEQLEAAISDEGTPGDVVSLIRTFFLSYYRERFVWFFPHVVGAIVWWNLYYLQLIPSIRRRYRKFHRILGRTLMISAVGQTVSGVGLAYMGQSPTVKIVSYLLAIAVVYCVRNAWYFAAIQKDVARHKYWAMRLVGYLQTIALQRVFMFVFILSHRTGWLGLYPPYEEDDEVTNVQCFEHSFVTSFIVAMLSTEWYLAGCYGWTGTAKTEDDGNDAAAGQPFQTRT